jgi:UDP-sulfoquinovose synthase
MQCVELAIRNPASRGEFRVFNQFTEQFSVMQLAEKVQAAGTRAGLKVSIQHLPNPRVELEQHYYNAKHTKLIDLGLKPHLLTDERIGGMLAAVRAKVSAVDTDVIDPKIKWAN